MFNSQIRDSETLPLPYLPNTGPNSLVYRVHEASSNYEVKRRLKHSKRSSWLSVPAMTFLCEKWDWKLDLNLVRNILLAAFYCEDCRINSKPLVWYSNMESWQSRSMTRPLMSLQAHGQRWRKNMVKHGFDWCTSGSIWRSSLTYGFVNRFKKVLAGGSAMCQPSRV